MISCSGHKDPSPSSSLFQMIEGPLANNFQLPTPSGFLGLRIASLIKAMPLSAAGTSEDCHLESALKDITTPEISWDGPKLLLDLFHYSSLTSTSSCSASLSSTVEIFTAVLLWWPNHETPPQNWLSVEYNLLCELFKNPKPYSQSLYMPKILTLYFKHSKHLIQWDGLQRLIVFPDPTVLLKGKE